MASVPTVPPPGVASTDFFSSVKSAFSPEGPLGKNIYIILMAVGFLITIALFYAFSPQDWLPYTTVTLSFILVLASGGILYKFSGRESVSNLVVRFMFSLYFFMTYAFFAFGFISDIINKKYQYSPAGFAGIFGVIFNFAFSKLLSKDPATEGPINPLCEIPGLSFLSSSIIPQPIMFILSATAYIATYISRPNKSEGSGFAVDKAYIWPSWVLYFVLWAFHSLILSGYGCMDAKKAFISAVVPLVWGSIAGVIGFSLLETPGSGTPANLVNSKNNPQSQHGGGEEEDSSIDTRTCSPDARDGEVIYGCSGTV